MNDFLDEDEYPTEEALEKIEKWSGSDIKGCFDFIQSLWNYPKYFNSEPSKEENATTYHISTIGWSGNESLIYALQKNFIIWHLTWVQSRRGGHYIFEVKNK